MRTNDPSFQAKLRHREKIARLQREADVKAVMGTPAGRRFVYDLVMGRCRYGEVYGANDAGIHRHAGRREVGVEIVNEVQDVDPEAWNLMMAERSEAIKNEKKLREAAETDNAQRGTDA